MNRGWSEIELAESCFTQKAFHLGHLRNAGHGSDIAIQCDAGTWGDAAVRCDRERVEQFGCNLVHERGFTRPQAYAICSVAVDLAISEIVDVPNVVVSAFLPLDIFV